ncbi:MAG: efflux transporter outer membrane subunit [Planctomycetota bacterium]|nr:MAG: efflux transporter outer membrane subunit [Planctomycetota bacterium]
MARIVPIRVVLVAALMLVAGCAVGPDYVKPVPIAPNAYKEMVGWKVAQPKDDVLRGPWWEIYGDPQLNALEEQVNVSNQTIALAETQFRQARALVQQARAAYFPTVTIGAGVTRSQRSATFGANPLQSVGAAFNDFTLPLDVTWQADVWGRIRRTVESNQASAQASAGDLENARLSVHAELAQDYFQLRTLDAQKQILNETVVALTKSLELTKNRYASGVASKADVLQAETLLKTTQAQGIDIGVQRAQLEHAIAVLIGRPPALVTIPGAPIMAVPPPLPIGVPSELLERRPDIAAAERRIAAANAQIGVAEAAYYPTVTLTASAGLESSSLSQWLTWPSRFWSVGPAVSQIVYDGGLRRAQTQQALAAYDVSIATYRQTVLTAFQGVEDNLAALRILEEEAKVQDEAVKASQQSLAVIMNQYKAGIVNYLNVITAQTTALTNQVTAIQILGRRMIANALLVQALGGGWYAADLPSTEEVTHPKRQGLIESKPVSASSPSRP